MLWLKHFDGYTKRKANGRTRLLIVDGHNSHYSFEFLDYARASNILVLCYPAHTTHIYQGLDVVVFSVLKRHWAEEKTKWEENGGEVTKETFLKIYGEAHIRTLRPDLIQKAFEKTGVFPFNPDVISPEMMAPSKETSLEGPLPLTPPAPVRIATELLYGLLHPSSAGRVSVTEVGNPPPTIRVLAVVSSSTPDPPSSTPDPPSTIRVSVTEVRDPPPVVRVLVAEVHDPPPVVRVSVTEVRDPPPVVRILVTEPPPVVRVLVTEVRNLPPVVRVSVTEVCNPPPIVRVSAVASGSPPSTIRVLAMSLARGPLHPPPFTRVLATSLCRPPHLSSKQVDSNVTDLIDHTIRQLEDPKLKYLTLTPPIKASSQQPPVITTLISPTKARFTDLLLASPKTDRERALIKAFQSLTLREAHYKGVVAGLQSSVILQQAYVERVHGQLEAKEKKRKKEKGALRGGHARLMTDDDFFNEIKAQKEEKAQQQVEKERKRNIMGDYKVAMEEWKKNEEARKVFNLSRHREWEDEVRVWKESPKPRGKRPLLGKPKKAEIKPTHPTNIVADEDEVRSELRTACGQNLTMSDRVPTTRRVTVTCDGHT